MLAQGPDCDETTRDARRERRFLSCNIRARRNECVNRHAAGPMAGSMMAIDPLPDSMTRIRLPICPS
jgi:hypothetical protein